MTYANATTVHRVCVPDVVAEDFQGQMVILNLATGHYFTLEGSGGIIWSHITSGCTPADILNDLAAAAPPFVAAGETFIRQLVENVLILADPSLPAAKLPAGTQWGDAAPRLEIYTELAELIASDPIHDVEASEGWPILAKAE